MRTGVGLLACLLAAFAVAADGQSRRDSSSAIADGRPKVRVFVPRTDNLQWMNFWVAQGAGLFEREGVHVEVVAGGGGEGGGEGGGTGAGILFRGGADVAVMPRPVFLTLVGQQQPVLAFANLLANDPINLIVGRVTSQARGISVEQPLAERLRRLEGLRIGVAPGPPTRLRVLFESAGLDVDDVIDVVVVEGEEQNAAFRDGRVDALYAHTPYLERSLVRDDAVVVVNQSGGEVPGLRNRQIHLMATTRNWAAANTATLEAFSRALYGAQQLIREGVRTGNHGPAINAIRASGAVLQEPGGLAALVAIYAPAIPSTPEVTVEGALDELALFPEHRVLPDLSRIDLEDYIDNRFAEAAIGTEP